MFGLNPNPGQAEASQLCPCHVAVGLQGEATVRGDQAGGMADGRGGFSQICPKTAEAAACVRASSPWSEVGLAVVLRPANTPQRPAGGSCAQSRPRESWGEVREPHCPLGGRRQGSPSKVTVCTSAEAGSRGREEAPCGARCRQLGPQAGPPGALRPGRRVSRRTPATEALESPNVTHFVSKWDVCKPVGDVPRDPYSPAGAYECPYLLCWTLGAGSPRRRGNEICNETEQV